jgi:virginiamycin B lyase
MTRSVTISFSLLFFLTFPSRTGIAQSGTKNPPTTPPEIKIVQVPFASLKPDATFKIGKTADWVEITKDAVWIAGTEPFSVHRINPKTNKDVATIIVPGEPCSGLALGFGSLWVPICGEPKPDESKPGKPNSIIRIDASTNKITATLSTGPAGPEGGIAASVGDHNKSEKDKIEDSVWIVTDTAGTLVRIDPSTNKVRQTISIAPGSYNPVFAENIIWITGTSTNTLTAVDASTGKVTASIPVGPTPRFLAAGGGSIWTLNQGDGTITRVDAKTRKVVATIATGMAGHGGDLAWGGGFVWASIFGVPLAAINPKTNTVFRQWTGPGGDSLRLGHGSVWLTDYRQGTLSRFSLASLIQ